MSGVCHTNQIGATMKQTINLPLVKVNDVHGDFILISEQPVFFPHTVTGILILGVGGGGGGVSF